MSAHSAHAEAHGHAPGAPVLVTHHHVSTVAILTKVFLTLVILTIITVGVSQVDFGSANMVIAMLVAAVKAALVMTFFMHLRYDTAINNIFILSSFAFLALLFVFTLTDFSTRKAVNPIHAKRAPIAEPDTHYLWKTPRTKEHKHE